MNVAMKKVLLKNGKECILRSPKAMDAQNLIEYMKKTAEESQFLLRYPEEVDMTVEDEAYFIHGMNESPDSFMILAEIDGRLAGNCSLSALGSRIRMKHRCNIAIALYEEFCSQGIGKVMMEYLLEEAKNMGFEQAELEVVARNERAISLYEKLGFEQVGMIPNAMKHKDGSYESLLMMVKRL